MLRLRKRRNDFKSWSAGHCGQGGAAAGAADLNVAGSEAGDQNRRAADEDRLDIDAVLAQQTLSSAIRRAARAAPGAA